MAIAHVQTLTPATAIGNATTTTLTPSASTTAGNLLVVALVAQGNDVISSVTDTQGNTWTVGPTIANGTNEGLSIAWTVQDVAGLTGADTITVNHTTSPGRALTCDEFSGIDTTTPTTGSAGTATGTSAAPAATMAGATTNADALIFGAVGYNGTTTHTADASYTETNEQLVTNGSVNRKVATEYQIVAATGTYGFTDTLSGSGAWTAAIMAFKAAAGGGGPTTFHQACDVSLTINDTIHPFNIRVGRSTTVGVTASRLSKTRKTFSATLGTAMAAVRKTRAIRSTTAAVTASRGPTLTRAIRSTSLGTSASVSRLTRKLLSGSLSVLATLATVLGGGGPTQYTQECLALIGTSVSTSRLSRKILSSVVSTVASLRRATRVARSASASLAPSIVRRVRAAHSVSVALSASRRVRVRTLRTVSLAVTASISKRIRKQLSTTLSLLASVVRAVIVPPRNDPQEQSITVDSSLNSASLRGTANSAEVDASLNSVRILSSPNTFEVTDG